MRPGTRGPRFGSAVSVVIVSLVVSACAGRAEPAGEGGPGTAPDRSGFPITVTADGTEITLDRRPERIVSLSPTSTEMLFAIGAGSQVVAVDSLSNYPKRAPRTTLSGFRPNVEAIAGFRPDLVVGDLDAGVVAELRALRILVLVYEAPRQLI